MKIAVITLACVLSAAAIAHAANAARQPNVLAAPMSVTLPETAKPEAAVDAKADKTEPSGQAVRVEGQAKPDGQAKPHVDAAHRVEAPRGRVCFNPAETREKIATHHLAEPFRALRSGRLQGEALRARLCRWKTDEFVYEVSVLRPNGHIAHVYMNAQNGQAVGALADPDRN